MTPAIPGKALRPTAAAVHQDPDFARLLTLVERSVVQRIGDTLRKDGATIEEWRVLQLLGDDAGHAMAEIAEFAMLLAPSLTKVVDRMVSVNLVHRRVDETDRRRVLVFATDRGRQALQRWSSAVAQEHEDIVNAVGSEEMALLRALLIRAAGNLG
jgi:DNA-binding MarR family transcriptional regulator